MPHTLHDILAARREEMGAEILRRLRGSTAVHYRQIDEDLLHERTQRLVDSFLLAVPGRPSVFIEYIKAVAAERIDEGYFLKEIQLALCILEEQAWTHAVEAVAPNGHVAALSMISGTIGAAKDQLAQVYLDTLKEARRRVADLERCCEVLSRGTESGPVSPSAYLGGE